MSALRLAAAIATVVALGAGAANAQTALPNPTTPGEIADVSRRIAVRNEGCRQQANREHLHLLKRRLFMYRCKKTTPL
jgi:hypothetical protein